MEGWKKDKIRRTLGLNALRFSAQCILPDNDALEMDTTVVLQSIFPYRNTVESLSAAAVMDRILNVQLSSEQIQLLKEDPDFCRSVEDAFLCNVHFRNYLSAVADAYAEDGDLAVKNYLLSMKAYVMSDEDKKLARDAINRPINCHS